MADIILEDVEAVIEEEQYRLKLGIVYFLLSKEAIGIMLFCFFVFDSITWQLGIGVLGLMIMYKFFFDKVKGDNYNVLLLSLVSKLSRMVRHYA